MKTDTTKTELKTGVYMWSDGTHTVTTLEVQAVKLAAKLHIAQLRVIPGETRMIEGFLLGQATEDEETVAKHIMEAKRQETDAGRVPMSADLIRH